MFMAGCFSICIYSPYNLTRKSLATAIKNEKKETTEVQRLHAVRI